MQRLFFVCFATFLCMVTKSILMLIIQLFLNGSYNSWIFALYFIIGEIVPFTLMLNLDFVGSSTTLDYAPSIGGGEGGGGEAYRGMTPAYKFGHKQSDSSNYGEGRHGGMVGSVNET